MYFLIYFINVFFCINFLWHFIEWAARNGICNSSWAAGRFFEPNCWTWISAEPSFRCTQRYYGRQRSKRKARLANLRQCMLQRTFLASCLHFLFCLLVVNSTFCWECKEVNYDVCILLFVWHVSLITHRLMITKRQQNIWVPCKFFM